MTPTQPLRVVRLPGSEAVRPGWFPPDSEYVRAVWLPVVGPAVFTVWRLLVELVGGGRCAVTTSLEELGASAGLGAAGGNQAGIVRCLRRMERFGLAWRPTGDLVVVRCSLPPVGGRFLAQLPASVQAEHERLFHVELEDRAE